MATFLAELHAAHAELVCSADGYDVLAPGIRALRRLGQCLSRPLKIAIFGEFNSGKSSLANFLAGIESLPTAVISNTRVATILYFAPEPEIFGRREDGVREALSIESDLTDRGLRQVEVGLPAAALRCVELIDAPSITNAVAAGVRNLMHSHRPDAVIWCTVAPQAWKETERAVWCDIPHLSRRHSLLVATHADLLQPEDRNNVRCRLEREAGEHFNHIAMIGTIRALDALGHSDADLAWRESGAADLLATLQSLLVAVSDARLARARAILGRVTGRALQNIAEFG